MDVVKAVETYVTRMVSEPSAMKVLLLDSHTVRGASPRSSRDLIIADPHRLPSLNTVYTTGPPGVPDRPHRQQEARAHDAHEVRLLPAEQRRQPRGDAARAKGAKVRRVLPVSVVVNHIHRASRVRRLANMTRRLQQYPHQVGH